MVIEPWNWFCCFLEPVLKLLYQITFFWSSFLFEYQFSSVTEYFWTTLTDIVVLSALDFFFLSQYGNMFFIFSRNINRENLVTMHETIALAASWGTSLLWMCLQKYVYYKLFLRHHLSFKFAADWLAVKSLTCYFILFF